jgi:hypothetical protein
MDTRPPVATLILSVQALRSCYPLVHAFLRWALQGNCSPSSCAVAPESEAGLYFFTIAALSLTELEPLFLGCCVMTPLITDAFVCLGFVRKVAEWR